MSDKKKEPAKIEQFGMTTAFVVVMDDGTVDVKALKPSEEQIVELTQHWTEQKLKQE